MVQIGRALGFQLRADLFDQLFAQFHAPLVEAVDAPDDPLDEDLVLVKGDELAQRLRVELLGQDGVGRTVAFKGLVADEVGSNGLPRPLCLGFELVEDFLFRFSRNTCLKK